MTSWPIIWAMAAIIERYNERRTLVVITVLLSHFVYKRIVFRIPVGQNVTCLAFRTGTGPFVTRSHCRIYSSKFPKKKELSLQFLADFVKEEPNIFENLEEDQTIEEIQKELISPEKMNLPRSIISWFWKRKVSPGEGISANISSRSSPVER